MTEPPTNCRRCGALLKPYERPEGICDQCLKDTAWDATTLRTGKAPA